MSAIYVSNARARRFILPLTALLLFIFIYSSTDSTAVRRVGSHLPQWSSGSSASTSSSSSFSKSAQQIEPIVLDRRCANSQLANDTLLVMKTGSSVIEKRLPIHFRTTFRCTPHFLVFSDLAQDFHGIEVHDSLDELYKYVDLSNPDLKYYEYLKRTRGKQKGWLGSLQEEEKFEGAESDAAWEMDKYKNIPILRKSYAMYPDKKWYIFVDADTTVMWSNLMTWLEQLNSSSIFYTGSQNFIGDVEFAHGGSGYVISQAAAKVLADEDEEQAKEHISYAEHQCCGDMVLAHAFHDHQIALNGSWPNIQGSTPDTLDYDDWKWCHAAMTFHHTTPEMTELLWELEREMSGQKNITYADIYAHIVQPRMRASALEWDNGSEERLYPPKRSREEFDENPSASWKPTKEELHYVSSFEGCRDACRAEAKCFQWVYKPNATSEGQPINVWPGQCGLQRAFTLGSKSDEGIKDGFPAVHSGWDLERIEQWVLRHACKEAIFLKHWDQSGSLEPDDEETIRRKELEEQRLRALEKAILVDEKARTEKQGQVEAEVDRQMALPLHHEQQEQHGHGAHAPHEQVEVKLQEGQYEMSTPAGMDGPASEDKAEQWA